MIFGQAKGLKPFYLLYRYQVRNAILPQITALAFSIGSIVAGQILVSWLVRFVAHLSHRKPLNRMTLLLGRSWPNHPNTSLFWFVLADF